MFFDKVYYDEDNNPIEVLIICDKCGKTIIVTDFDKIQTIQNEYCVLKPNEIIKCECGNCASGKIEYKKTINIKDAIINKHSNSSYLNKPHCPTCNSTNITKISGTKRFITTGLFGLASSNVGKTMECKNCGYKW